MVVGVGHAGGSLGYSQYDPARLTSFIQFLERLDFAYYLRGHDDFKLTKEEILNKLKAAL